MFQPLAQISRSREVAQSFQIPASTKGWIKNQAITRMDPEGAYQIDNWFPNPDGLDLRKGSQIFASPPDHTPVETVLGYLSSSVAGGKLFAALNGKIYDVTAGGVPGAPVLSGLGSNRWQYVNFANSAGNWLICVNGVDPPQGYNGTAWAPLAITGPSPVNSLSNVWAYQGTLFFTQVGTPNAWYLAPGAVQGAATQIPLGAQLVKGGPLMAGGQWTFASSYSILNLCMFLSTEGEVLIYQGNNPASASTWSLVGQFVIGRPIGPRCLLNINSDLVVLCQDGLMPLSKALEYDRTAAASAAFTWNIQDAFNDAYQLYGQNFGWQIISFPLSHMALINVPTAPGSTAMQFVEDVISGAWARYIGLNAECWCTQQDVLYFGGYDGNVWQAETGGADGTQPISAQWVSAFNDLNAPGRLKSARAVRAVFLADTGIAPQVGVCVDYDVALPPATAYQLTVGASLWDVAKWDVNLWNAVPATIAPWVAALGNGYQLAVTVCINLASATPTAPVHCKIVSTYVLYEPGAWLG